MRPRATLIFLLAGCFQSRPEIGPCTTTADCPTGEGCSAEGVCVKAASHCTDHVLNGGETDVDCGGGCPTRCALDKRCISGSDCKSAYCNSGLCATGGSCGNNLEDGSETDVDCGGGCPACANGKHCLTGTDCQSGQCSTYRCVDAA
jgi:hypothetical protein